MQRSCYECLSSMWSVLARDSLQVCIRASHCALRAVKPTVLPIPVAARSKSWVCGRSLAGIVVSNPAGGRRYLSVVIVVCCQGKVSASG
jgi:hypothetical protein